MFFLTIITQIQNFIFMKTLLKVLAGLIAVFLLVGFFAPKEYHVERTVTIDANKATIFPHVKSFEKQGAWSPWQRQDPELKPVLEGVDGTVGSKMSWDSEKSGAGSQVATEIVENETMKTDLEFTKPFESSSKTFINLKENEETTDVTWGFYGKHGFIESIMMMFMDLDASVGADYKKGLEYLKEIVEKEVKSQPQLTVQEVEWPVQHYVAVREVVGMDKISERYAVNLPKIAGLLASKNIEMAGMPSGIFYNWDVENNRTDVAQAIPVSKATKIEGYESIELPAGKALLVNFYGEYSQTVKAHDLIDKYLADNDLKSKFPVIEQYITDPTTEPDPNKWLTKVYYFLDEVKM